MFHGSFKEVSRELQVTLKGVSRVFQGCFKGVSWVFQGCFKGVSRGFQECFKEFMFCTVVVAWQSSQLPKLVSL